MNWLANCSYDDGNKAKFHSEARARLRALARELRFPPGSFDLRSCKGGVAVSGEAILHHERVHIQVCQPATRCDSGILVRTCRDRRDFYGGRNHLMPLALLDDLSALAARVRAIMR